VDFGADRIELGVVFGPVDGIPGARVEVAQQKECGCRGDDGDSSEEAARNHVGLQVRQLNHPASPDVVAYSFALQRPDSPAEMRIELALNGLFRLGKRTISCIG